MLVLKQVVYQQPLISFYHSIIQNKAQNVKPTTATYSSLCPPYPSACLINKYLYS